MEHIRAELHQVVDFVTNPVLILVWFSIIMVCTAFTAVALMPWFLG